MKKTKFATNVVSSQGPVSGSGLKIAYHNAQLSSLISENIFSLHQKKYDIFAVTEPNPQIISIVNKMSSSLKVVAFNDNPRCAIIILNHRLRYRIISNSRYITVISLIPSDLKIVCAYIPPLDSPYAQQGWSAALSAIHQYNHNAIMLTDANAHYAKHLGGSRTCLRGRSLYKTAKLKGWRIVNTINTPTRINNQHQTMIDWTLATEQVTVSQWQPIQTNAPSDHVMISLTLSVTKSEISQLVVSFDELKLLLNQSDYIIHPSRFHEFSSRILKNCLIEKKPSVKRLLNMNQISFLNREKLRLSKAMNNRYILPRNRLLIRKERAYLIWLQTSSPRKVRSVVQD